jgi:diguanylate cyclase (GGDEF)-like protein
MPIQDDAGAVTGCVEIFSDMSQQVAMKERLGRLEKLALIDPLTGLANRRFLERSLIALLDASRRYGWVFGVGMADIDEFKHVNDTYGHNVGDKALRMVAENLRANSRAFDTPGRWGGEEFVIISQNVDTASHLRIAERYRSLIESSMIPGTADKGRLTISIGITLAKPGDTMAGVIERADGLMYAAKQGGRNRVVQG